MNEALTLIFTRKAQEASAQVFISEDLITVKNYISVIIKNNGYQCFTSPGLNSELTLLLEKEGLKKISEPVRNNTDGIRCSIINASFGIAETGTVVVNSESEDISIATMLSELNFILLDPENIVGRITDLKEILEKWFSGINYTSFITGPSRTADIERVLTLGAHGPESVHIIITKN